jgi:2-phosphoglycerate kinase
VILIGGPPMIGKTTIASRLAARLDYGTMSTDDLGQCIRDVTTPDSHPNLHLMSGIDHREYYVSRSTERLIRDAENQPQASCLPSKQLSAARGLGRPHRHRGLDVDARSRRKSKP